MKSKADSADDDNCLRHAATIPCRIAYRTNAATSCTPSFAMRRVRWLSAVFAEIANIAAICFVLFGLAHSDFAVWVQ